MGLMKLEREGLPLVRAIWWVICQNSQYLIIRPILILLPKFGLTTQTIWLQELLEPKVLNAATLNQTEQPIMPMNVTATFPELGPRSYGFGTWTYTYRGIQILE